MLLGFLGAIIPIVTLMTGYYYLEVNINQQNTFSFINIIPFHPFAWELALIILAIGTLIGIWGSVMSIRKFLKV